MRTPGMKQALRTLIDRLKRVKEQVFTRKVVMSTAHKQKSKG